MAGGALFTYSRQAYFMVMLAVALLLLRKNIIVAVAVGAILISFASYLPDAVTQRVDETKQTGKGGQEEVDDEHRQPLGDLGRRDEMLKDNPIGVGLNRFKTQIGNYTSPQGLRRAQLLRADAGRMRTVGLITLLLLIRALFSLPASCATTRPPTIRRRAPWRWASRSRRWAWRWAACTAARRWRDP